MFWIYKYATQFIKKFLLITNLEKKSKFLSTLRSITIIWLRWNIHDVLLPFVFVLTFFRASSAKEKHVASAFLQSTKPKLSQLFNIFDTKATKTTETTSSTSACRNSTHITYAKDVFIDIYDLFGLFDARILIWFLHLLWINAQI